MAFKVSPAPNMPDREYKRRSKVEAMLRQAADAEEELERALKNEKALELRVDFWRCEHNALKTRLEAVVKECEKSKWHTDNWLVSVRGAAYTHNRYIDRILRAARGEGGAE